MSDKKIASTNDEIQLFMITPIYKSKIKTVKVNGEKTDVEQQVLVKELHTKKWIRKDAITSVEDYVTNKNTISKTRAVIFDKYSNRFFVTAHNVDNIHEVLSPNKVREIGIGFKQNQPNATDFQGTKPLIRVNGNGRKY